MKKTIVAALAGLAAMSLAAGELKFISHRGESLAAPENTVTACRLALEGGADGFEFDLRLSGDGEIVVFHDANAKRLTGNTLEVARTAAPELRKLDVGSHKGEQFSGEMMPLFREIAALRRPGKLLLAEIKAGTVIPKLKSEIAELGIRPGEMAFLAGFKNAARLRRELPEFTVYALVFPKVADGRLKPSADELIGQLRESGGNGVVFMKHALLDRAYVEQVRNAGFIFQVAVIDRPDQARHYAALGVDEINSNRAAALKKEFTASPARPNEKPESR